MEVTKSYRWDATVRSYIVSAIQGHNPDMVGLKARRVTSEHLGNGEFRMRVTATPYQHEAIKAAVHICKAGL